MQTVEKAKSPWPPKIVGRNEPSSGPFFTAGGV
jgi:hypothetical protein